MNPSRTFFGESASRFAGSAAVRPAAFSLDLPLPEGALARLGQSSRRFES